MRYILNCTPDLNNYWTIQFHGCRCFRFCDLNFLLKSTPPFTKYCPNEHFLCTTMNREKNYKGFFSKKNNFFLIKKTRHCLRSKPHKSYGRGGNKSNTSSLIYATEQFPNSVLVILAPILSFILLYQFDR